LPSALGRLDIGFGGAAQPLILWFESESTSVRDNNGVTLWQSSGDLCRDFFTGQELSLEADHSETVMLGV